MYSIQEIENDIENFFYKETPDEIEERKRICKAIVDMTDINEACNKIFAIRDQYVEKQRLPIWFRKMVFLCIYQYLSPIYKAIETEKLLDKDALKQIAKTKKKNFKNQSELLEHMGLENDIFKKSHWNMYSPDMKARQQIYIPMRLPLNYAEVECNDVYRAMIHYMVAYADVHTDTFVDVFGKLGLPAMFCANGYPYRAVWVEDGKLIRLFSEAVQHNGVKIYKQIFKIQKLLNSCDFKEQKEVIKELLQIFWMKQFLYARTEECEIDKITFAAEFFFVNCFTPEYWLDSMKEIEERSDGEREVSEYLNVEKITRNKIKRFVNLKKEEFLYFAKQYQKLRFVEIDRMQAIEHLQQFSMTENPLHDALLYIDIPKYIREYGRFGFDAEKCLKILELLEKYKGNWILTWKNYLDKTWTAGKEKSIFHELHVSKTKETINVDILMEHLENIHKMLNSNEKELWVFKYRDGNNNHANSIIFITNIQLSDISVEKFMERYSLTNTENGELIKETFSEFNKKRFKLRKVNKSDD